MPSTARQASPAGLARPGDGEPGRVRSHVSVAGRMSDNIRTALHDARHTCVLLRLSAG